jgi:hypothetical protein
VQQQQQQQQQPRQGAPAASAATPAGKRKQRQQRSSAAAPHTDPDPTPAGASTPQHIVYGDIYALGTEQLGAAANQQWNAALDRTQRPACSTHPSGHPFLRPARDRSGLRCVAVPPPPPPPPPGAG